MSEPSNAVYRAPVPSHLRGDVVSIHAFDIRRGSRVTHRALPVPIVPVIVGIDHEHTLEFAPGDEVTLGSFVAGLTDSTVLVEAPRFTGVQVDLSPLGAWKVFGPQTADLAGAAVSVEDALGLGSAGGLSDRLGSMTSWEQRLGFVTELISSRLAVAPLLAPEVEQAWRLLEASRGRDPIGEVATAVGWSPRHLASRFRQHVGMTPKRTARLLRFHAAAGMLTGHVPLAEIAYICGYSDQSHFTNEVVEHSGLTPVALRGELGADSVRTSDEIE